MLVCLLFHFCHIPKNKKVQGIVRKKNETKPRWSRLIMFISSTIKMWSQKFVIRRNSCVIVHCWRWLLPFKMSNNEQIVVYIKS